jgi:hypothetical protein
VPTPLPLVGTVVGGAAPVAPPPPHVAESAATAASARPHSAAPPWRAIGRRDAVLVRPFRQHLKRFQWYTVLKFCTLVTTKIGQSRPWTSSCRDFSTTKIGQSRPWRSRCRDGFSFSATPEHRAMVYDSKTLFLSTTKIAQNRSHSKNPRSY